MKLQTKSKRPPLASKVRIRSRKFPIFPVRLRPDDRETVEVQRKRYGLRTLAEAMRVSHRVLSLLDLSVEQVASLNAKYQESHPDSLVIPIPLPVQD